MVNDYSSTHYAGQLAHYGSDQAATMTAAVICIVKDFMSSTDITSTRLHCAIVEYVRDELAQRDELDLEQKYHDFVREVYLPDECE